MSYLAKEIGYLLFAGLALCNGQGKINQSFFIPFKLDAVERQEDDSTSGAGALVAVHKRMVLNDVVEVCRSHFKQVLMEELASKGCLWHGNRRVQKADVAHAFGTSVVLDQTEVRPEDAFKVQEQRLHGSMLLRKSFHRTAKSLMDHIECILKLRLVLRISDRAQNQAPPIGDNFKRRVGRHAKQFENWLLNHQRVTVAMFGQGLDHGRTSGGYHTVSLLYHRIAGLATRIFQPQVPINVEAAV
jgi:hypothetical protein